MTCVIIEMSTDRDIVGTQLNPAWTPILARYNWGQISHEPPNLNVPDRATIVVIAHGNGDEIGNAQSGAVDISPSTLLVLIQHNMANHAMPAAIYLSTCGPGIAQFAAAVRIAAGQNNIWANTRIFGHNDPVAGSVPPPSDIRWVQIF